jgi:Ca2+-binding EF-hand superfamily protein
MKTNHRSEIVLILALVALTGCQTNRNLQPSEAVVEKETAGFDVADANHDGKLSRDEASDFLVGEIFTARDANHDGQLTREEWGPGKDFAAQDKNHDGVVTKAEAMAYGRAHGVANKIAREGDTNGDGVLDRAEVEAYYKRREGPPR